MINQKNFRGVGGIYYNYKLNNSFCRSWQLKWKPICASTEIELSNWIKEKKVQKNQPRAIFSSSQKFGHGQFGRNWYSPRGGVWVSAAIQREGAYEKNTELYGLALALAMVERIELKGINVKIKWPNDLMVGDKKLAGILPRLFFRGGLLRLLRVGIGLNVFNHVPDGGISVKQIIGEKHNNLNFWSSEVLFAIERSLDLLNNKKLLCSQVEEKLWTKKYIDKKSGNQFNIKGIHSTGGLIILKEGKETVLTI